MVKYMKLFNDVRNFIDDNSFKLIIYNDLIDVINYQKINDINDTYIKILSDKEINILGKDLCILKLKDNEILIKGSLKDISFNG